MVRPSSFREYVRFRHTATRRATPITFSKTEGKSSSLWATRPPPPTPSPKTRPPRPVRRSGHHDRVRRRPEAGGGDEKEGVRRCSPERLLRRAGPHVLSGHRQAPGGGRWLPLASDPLRQRREEALTPQRHQHGPIRNLQDNALAVVENRNFDRFGVRAHRAALHLHPDRVRSAPDEAGLRARASRSKAAGCAVAAPAPSRQAQLCGAAPAAVLFPGYGENEDQSGHDGSSSNEAERRG